MTDLKLVSMDDLIAELTRRGAFTQKGGFTALDAWVGQVPVITPVKVPAPIFSPYKSPVSDAVTMWGDHVPDDWACLLDTAALLIAELRARFTVSSPYIFYGPGPVVTGTRRPWCIDVNGQTRLNVQQLIVARYIDGIGAPGDWDFSTGASARWHPLNKDAAPWDISNTSDVVRN